METVLAPLEATNARGVTGSSVGVSRLRVDGFTGWQRQWLRVLIAVQILCENLLLVDCAITAREIVQRYKLKAQGCPEGYRN